MSEMTTFALGQLKGGRARSRLDLLAPTTRSALEEADLLDEVGLVEIDPAISDTAATKTAFGLDGDWLANCVVVAGKRDGEERVAACVVLSTTRADINGAVKRLLDVRKASFMSMDRAVQLTGMEYGGITPIGLPSAWPVFVDSRVTEIPLVIIGSGVRRSKILVPGPVLGRLAAARVIEGLGIIAN
jgi:prolyl-tRNA editing enzyme YbaK/EbsC (Cys-tRNA(Pro) deacylase)